MLSELPSRLTSRGPAVGRAPGGLHRARNGRRVNVQVKGDPSIGKAIVEVASMICSGPPLGGQTPDP